MNYKDPSIEVLLYKLVSGDTVLAEYVGSDETVATVANPVALVVNTAGRGIALSSTVWVPFAREGDTVIDIKKEHIITTLSVDEETELYYDKTVAYLQGDGDKLERLSNLSKENDFMTDEEMSQEIEREIDREVEKEETNKLFSDNWTANTVH
jgi:hypothetical protein